MKLGSLFTGIGGLDLGVEAALRESGITPEIAFQVEQDPFCLAILKKHWPLVNRTITDVRLVTTQSLPRVDLLVGGFPCQDVSGAGDGEGLGTEEQPTHRSGLWFEFKRIAREFQPAAVIVENVASGKKRWLCQVRTDLHSLGYRTRAVQVSAADVGAPHKRERVFVLAVADADRHKLRDEQGRSGGKGGAGAAESGDARPELGHAWSSRREGASGEGLRRARESDGSPDADRRDWQVERDVGRVADGLSRGLDCHRWPAPRGAEQHPWEAPRTIEGKQAHRRQRLKGLGNAVVPHQAYAAVRVLIEWMRGGNAEPVGPLFARQV